MMKKSPAYCAPFRQLVYISFFFTLIIPVHARVNFHDCAVCTEEPTTTRSLTLHKKQAPDVFTIFSVKNMDVHSLIPAGKKVLVIFDIDKTLITSTDTASRDDYTYHTLHDLEKKGTIAAPKDAAYFNSIIWRDEGKMIMEPAMKNLFDALKQTTRASVEVIAMTDVSGGPYGTFPDMLDWRYHNLKEMGFTFSSRFPNTTFTQLQKNESVHPRLYRGIIGSNGVPKGTVLIEFLRTLDYKPDLIIFFDDMFKNIASVQKAAHKLHIPFKGFYYLKKLKLPGKLNRATADKEIQYLLKHDIWLPGETHNTVQVNKTITKENL